jgi:glucans biosynthesis protein
MAGMAALAAFAGRPAFAQILAQTKDMSEPPPFEPFSAQALRRFAQSLAQRPPRAPVAPVAAAQALTYDDQRRLRFRADHALWADQEGPFRAELFPAVYLAARPVRLFEVVEGRASPVHFAPRMFDAPDELAPALASVAGFSGFRLLWPLNDPGKRDEIGAFQGASYFRSLGRGQHYGLSARGLSLRTGERDEEFPQFTAWWIERPAPGADRVVLHALMESESVTGAYRIQVIPGPSPIYDVEAEVYPRRTIEAGGVAPMSSMFLFGSIDRPDQDDFRSAVHDSDGLAIRTRDGGMLWRPLSNPRRLQISRFETDALAGFGLLQRARGFDDYGDLEARYDRRPSLWIEPLDDWGAGAVHLVEIPTRLESDDNIACFWRPARAWPAGAPVSLRYRLTWGNGPEPGALAQVTRTRSGADGAPGVRLYTIDFAGGGGDLADVEPEVKADGGAVVWSAIQPHATPGAVRVGFGFRPGSGPAELSVRLLRGAAPASETWRYRWS